MELFFGGTLIAGIKLTNENENKTEIISIKATKDTSFWNSNPITPCSQFEKKFNLSELVKVFVRQEEEVFFCIKQIFLPIIFFQPEFCATEKRT